MTPVAVALMTDFYFVFVIPHWVFVVQVGYPSIVAIIATTPVHLSTALWTTLFVKFDFVVHVSSQTRCRPTVVFSRHAQTGAACWFWLLAWSAVKLGWAA